MAIDPWPATLPQVIRLEGYSDSMGDGLIRSPTDSGPGKVRRRSSAVVRPLQCRMYMTEAQLLIMRTFITTTLMGGALPFSLPDPIDGTTMWCRFREMPAWINVSGTKYDISLNLEILPQ